MKLKIFILIFLFSCEITEVEPRISYYGDSVILSVPIVPMEYACAVTSIGMLMNYYDLVDSSGDLISEQHMKYYAYPKDEPGHLLPDSSISDNPPQNCLADFLHTSWYTEGNWYGVTEFYSTVPGIEGYLEFKGRGKLEFWNVTSFGDYVSSINNLNPVFMVTGNHARLGVGYVRSDSSLLSHDSKGDIVKLNWDEVVATLGIDINLDSF